MGLLQDSEGIPIACDLFRGNTNDCETLLPVLKGRRGRGKGRVVVVADKGMNRSDNIAGAVAGGAHYGAAQYVRDVTFDAKTGEALEEAGVRPQIDQAAIDEAARLDGYHLIVTSETDWEDFRILDAYRELWRIEESFKVTKTGGLESRPVWAWTESHIRAHFLTCYLALLIVRLSQCAPPSHPSARALLEDMRDLGCSYADDGWWLFDHRTDLTDEIFALADEEAPRKWMRTADVRALFKKGKKIHWR